MSHAPKNSLVRSATARWAGTLAKGEGRLSTDSRVLADACYSFPTRFAHAPGTNPEELIAAAHAGCYAMALAYALDQAGAPPQHIEVSAALALETGAGGPNVAGIHLRVQAQVPGLDEAAFVALARQAEHTCLVSRLLDVAVTLDAALAAST